MDKVKVVSFDAEGTLVTPDFSTGMWYECIPEAYGKKRGLPLEQAREAIFKEYERVGDSRIEWYDVRYWFKHFELGDYRESFERCKCRIQLYPEVFDVLKAVDGKYRLVVLSATVREFLDHLVSGVSGHFDTIVSSISEYQTAKTPEFYTRVCRDLGVSPGEMVHVGDSRQYDFLNAQQAGVRAFHLDRKGEHNGPLTVRSLAEFCQRLPPR